MKYTEQTIGSNTAHRGPMNTIKAYWDHKYIKKELIWGLEPSISARMALEHLAVKKSTGSRQKFTGVKLLDIGCGYGRDSAWFMGNDFTVTGIDVSCEGIKMAQRLFPSIKFLKRDLITQEFAHDAFHVIFGNFFIHLVTDAAQRQKLIKEMERILCPQGHLFMSVASTDDDDFRSGKKSGSHTATNERGVKKRYYDEKLIYKEFAGFDIETVHPVNEHHTHDRPHTHKSHLIVARKRED